ncbi:MAG: GYF domain-containing protein [Muribaculaceae bacterium]|nr:GYF domain-containing protein [Muribaculaceae bacterium]
MRTYYFVIDDQQYGPVQPDQVTSLDITPSTLTWHEGLENWVKASDIPEIANILSQQRIQSPAYTPVPPVHDEEPVSHPATGNIHPVGTDSECPKPRLGLAIFSAIMFPIGIAAIVKTSLIKTRWEQGRHDDARWLAKSAHKYAIASIISGISLIAFIIFYYVMLISILIYGY